MYIYIHLTRIVFDYGYNFEYRYGLKYRPLSWIRIKNINRLLNVNII